MISVIKTCLNLLLVSGIWMLRASAQPNLIHQNDTTICEEESVNLSVSPLAPAPDSILLPPGSRFEYSFDPAPTNWNTSTGGWQIGNAPFGSDDSFYDPDFFYNTFWPSDRSADGTDLYLRTTIDLTGFDLKTIKWYIGVDNGYKLYINGQLVSSNYAPGYTYRWEYTGAIPENVLKPGKNIIAIELENATGSTAFDMIITGKEIRSILWSTREITNEINVTPDKSTEYSVKITSGRTIITDRVTVGVNTKPVPNLLPNVIICENEPLVLKPGNFQSYLWQDGSTAEYLTIKDPGTYSVTVTNSCGTTTASTVAKIGTCQIYFPNAFTPNNDGKNDIFRVSYASTFTKYHLIIFDRWGQKVFETYNPSQGWDGNINAHKRGAEVFVWLCSFQKSNGDNSSIKGTVTLIR